MEKSAFTSEHWLLAICLLALLLLCGCKNPYSVYQHRHTGYDFCGDPNIAYYHYPHGSWYIPAQQTSKHCPTMVEAPFHGFQSTCWTQWPEPWSPCPPPGMCPAPGEEIIETPLGEPMPPQQSHRRTQIATPVAQKSLPNAPAELPQRVSVVTETPLPMKFVGKHGFSLPESDGPSSAVIVELPQERSIVVADEQNSKANEEQASPAAEMAHRPQKERSLGKQY